MYYTPSTEPNPKMESQFRQPSRKQPKPKRPASEKPKSEALILLFCIFVPLYMEFVVKIVNGTAFSARIFLYLLLFSTARGLMIYFICRLFPKRSIRLAFLIIVTTLQILICATEMILYQTFFKQYQGLGMIFDNAGDVAGGFGGDAVRSIFAYIIELVLLIAPLVLLIVFNRRIVISARPKKALRVASVAVMAASYLLALLLIYTDGGGYPNDKDYYTSSYTVTDAMERFGVLSGVRLDLNSSLFGKPGNSIGAGDGLATLDIPKNDADAPGTDVTGPADTIDTIQKEPEYGFNTLNIDFAARAAADTNSDIKELDEYFATQTPSKQNKYTGIFKGKNCIFITAESFTPYFVSKEATPTLYKMMNNGFVFRNYYQPAWGVSTSDGEYSGLTGLVPEGGINSMKTSKNNNLYTSLGNTFTRLGYYTAAYHPNSYTYYDRNLTHPNFGYSEFIGWGNGIEVGVDKTWPESDLQAFETVIPWFIDKQPFHIYFMSVSGHPLYSFSGNYMASKNKDLVADLPYSDSVKAYYACNYEFEFAMEYLLDQLEKAGILDDTVIVINADHYPYGLDNGFEGNTEDYLSELVGHTVDQNFERHKNQLIIYCSSMKEPVYVDDPCYSLDILPTLSNLFGFEFDSRLYTGRDVFSDATPLVLFRNYSWITDMGKYNSSTKEFVPNDGVTVPDDYVSQVSSVVRSKIYVAARILDLDYYNKLFG